MTQDSASIISLFNTEPPAHEADLVPSPRSFEELRVMTMPRGGTDKLSFTTWDTIDVDGYGEDTFQLQGHYMIERRNPTSAIWSEASVEIFMREMSLVGFSEKFGEVQAFTNTEDPDRISKGRVMPGTKYPGFLDSPKLCIMEGFMMFRLPDAGLTLFNKDPIRLQHHITHIPPIGQGGGTQGRVGIDLYLRDDPEGAPVAKLQEVRTHIGAWLQDNG